MAVAVGGVFLAWLSTAGYLPGGLTNAPAYLVAAAGAEALVVGYGVATIGAGMTSLSFGYRQIGAGLLAATLALGFGGQTLRAIVGGWSVGPSALPSAWPVIDSATGSFRIAWIGRDDGAAFPAPGGDPQGVVHAGELSLRYALTDRRGVSALDVGRGPVGQGYEFLERALEELLAGGTSHAGALLAPLGVRFLVARAGDLPPTVERRLQAQVDLDLVPAGGLMIYRDARALPPAFLVPPSSDATIRTADLEAISSMSSLHATPLVWRASGVRVPEQEGTAVLGQQFDPGWRATSTGGTARPERAFGWAMAFPDASGSSISFSRQWVRTAEIAALAVLWLAALWITRRPATR
jgi:hypothetical protein